MSLSDDIASGKAKGARVYIKSRTIDLLDENAGSVSPDSDDNLIEYSTDGFLTVDGDTVRIAYEELEELGMKDAITTLMFDRRTPGYINMVRSGPVTAGLVFDSGVRRQNCALSAAGMAFQFCIHTRKVENTVTEKGGRIDLDYLLEFHGVKTERTRFHMDVVAGEDGKK